MKMRKGFTLIELLVVIAIIGILASLIIVSLSGARQKATDTQLKNNARNLDTALAQYYLDQTTQAYPVAATAGGTEVSTALSAGLSSYLSGGASSAAFSHSGTDAKYISPAGGATYMQAWTLKSGTETAITSGNGIYAITAASSGTVTANSLTVTGMLTAFTTATKAFVTYGPQ